MKRITLTRKGFREWLEGKPGKVRVGWADHSRCCPIANYLHDLGMEIPEVTGTFGPRWGSRKPLPKWTIQFISKIDRAPAMSQVTARQALAVLDGKEATP